jgi:hypothetical protein
MSDADDSSRFERQSDASQIERLRVGKKVHVVGGLYAGYTGVIVMIIPPRLAPFIVAFGDDQWTYCGSDDLEPA